MNLPRSGQTPMPWCSRVGTTVPPSLNLSQGVEEPLAKMKVGDVIEPSWMTIFSQRAGIGARAMIRRVRCASQPRRADSRLWPERYVVFCNSPIFMETDR